MNYIQIERSGGSPGMGQRPNRKYGVTVAIVDHDGVGQGSCHGFAEFITKKVGSAEHKQHGGSREWISRVFLADTPEGVKALMEPILKKRPLEANESKAAATSACSRRVEIHTKNKKFATLVGPDNFMIALGEPVKGKGQNLVDAHTLLITNDIVKEGKQNRQHALHGLWEKHKGDCFRHDHDDDDDKKR